MSQDLSKLTFADATPEQFRQFFEGQGWTIVTSGDACRDLGSGHFCEVSAKWGFVQLYKDCWHLNVAFPTTFFGEALEAANELANTRAFGGWAE